LIFDSGCVPLSLIVMKNLYLIVGLSFVMNGVFAQVNTDSLWNIWHNQQQPDTIRLKVLHDIAWDMIFTNPDSGVVLARQELAFAEKVGKLAWQGKAYNIIGSAHNLKGEYALALTFYQKGMSAMEAAGNQKKGIAAICNNMGLIYRSMGDAPKALEFFKKDLTTQEELANKEGIANAYINIGNIYDDQSNFTKALDYYQKALDLQRTVGDDWGMATALNNIGNMYLSQMMYPKALEYHQQCLAIWQKLDEQRGIGIVYTNIGLVYQELGEPEKSLSYIQKGIAILEKISEKPELATSYFSLGSIYRKQKNYTQAIGQCKKALDLSRQINAVRTESTACDCLYQTYKAMGQHKTALAYHEQYLMLNDSLQRDATNQRLEQMEFARQLLLDSIGKEEEKQQIKLSYQAELNEKTQSRNMILIAGMLVLLAALALLGRMLYFQKRSQDYQQKARDLEKLQLISEIDLLRTQVNPHFLFNSLSILSSLVHVNADLSVQFIEQLSKVYRYILEHKDQQIVPLRTELDLLQSYVFLLKIRFDDKFQLHVQLDDTVLDRYKIAPLTLQLLVENAVKHNRMSAKEPLEVTITTAGEYLLISNPLRLRQLREPSTGTGLSSIIHRYVLLSPLPAQAGEKGDNFEVRVPLLV
jgi:tetratricopeptide (TPR) repeat protein